MKKMGIFLPALFAIVLAGCTTTAETNNVEDGDIVAVPTTKPVLTDEEATAQIDTTLSPKERNPNVKPMPMPTVKPQVKAKPKAKPVTKPIKTADGKLILGEEEWVMLSGLNKNSVARIDTGASVSSISAIDVVNFERDGKQWVRFKLSHDAETSKEIETPVIETVKIVQASSDAPTKRYVIEGWIQIGDLKVKTPFSLSDRSHMDYGVLLGRSFSRDIAVVDVSRKFVQPKVTSATKK